MANQESISRKLVKNLLGGKWPDLMGTRYEGFGFEEVVFVIEDGMIHPSDGCGGLIYGPSFELKMEEGMKNNED